LLNTDAEASPPEGTRDAASLATGRIDLLFGGWDGGWFADDQTVAWTK
jgi:hypothetical protein